MKRISIIAFALVLTLSLAACGRRNDTNTSQPSTDATILPDMDPTIDTNIPDPSVDTSMPMYTDGTDNTEGIGTTDDTQAQSGRGF